eukprot:3365228-Pyramimonas_sp.AAC.1
MTKITARRFGGHYWGVTSPSVGEWENTLLLSHPWYQTGRRLGSLILPPVAPSEYESKRVGERVIIRTLDSQCRNRVGSPTVVLPTTTATTVDAAIAID